MKHILSAICPILLALSLFLGGCARQDETGAIPVIGTVSPTVSSAEEATSENTAHPTPTKEPTDQTKPPEPPSREPVPLQNGYTLGIEQASALQAISELFSSADSANAAVFCYDRDSGAVFCSDTKTQYHTQSTIKAPYIMGVLRLLGNDTASALAERLTLRQAEIRNGVGTVKNSPVGTSFTVRELMVGAITISDNTAYQMLYDRFGDEPFNALSESLGLTARLAGSQFCNCSVEEMGRLFCAIWEQDYPEKEFLLEQLNAAKNNFLISAALPGYKVAHKYGLATGMGDCHDAAIVFAEHPYILVIFSKYNPAANEPYAAFRALAKQVDAAHTALWQRDMSE